MPIVSLPLPIQLVNGNVADGGQVMTDLNAIASNVNANAAASGVNNDITALNALVSLPSGLTVVDWDLTAPNITGGTLTGVSIDSTSTAVTLPTGTNTNQIATMAAIVQAGLSSVLPGQPGGQPIYFLTTRNSFASWTVYVNDSRYKSAQGL
jgi:hypothetical protein